MPVVAGFCPSGRCYARPVSRPVRIEIVSDPVCPWCYIGGRRLARALAGRPDVVADVHWLPFQLSPDLPREGRDRREHYAALFGAERAAQILAGMAERGRDDGIAFQLKPGARSPHTLSAQVLLYWAGRTPGVDQGAVAEALFKAHHEDCDDIGDPAVLARVAAAHGMDGERVRADLAAGRDEAVVQAQIEELRQLGIGGVPFFIFDRRLAVSGAQPPEAFLEVLDQLAAG
jgi:predicted DsbA family dithiol-disulfide isomerase